MVGLDQQSAPKQLINEVPSHVVLVNNAVGTNSLFRYIYSGIAVSSKSQEMLLVTQL